MGLIVVVLFAVMIICIVIASTSIQEGVGDGKSDFMSGGILLIIIAIVLFFIIANMEIKPTCTLDGLL